MFTKRRIVIQKEAIGRGPVPKHLAIIMDGNGRWAKKRGLPRVAGHRAGMDAISRCLEALKGLEVKYLTLYAFSTENWRRPKAEVDYLMNLPGQFIAKELDTMLKNNIRLQVVGDIEGLPAHTQSAVVRGTEATVANTGLTLCFALNYGGREEILMAARQLGKMCKNGIINPDDISSETFEKCLFTADMPNPDLIIRTSGEIRVSNFLLWQMAYSELYFIDTLWPDFNELHLYEAIADFQRRQRRFGGI